MAVLDLNFNVTGEDTLDADWNAEKALISAAVTHAMVKIGGLMTDALKKHIDKDVYAKFVPKDYPRRSEHPQFGTPLNDVATNSHAIFDVIPGKIGGRVGLDYRPTGEHSGTTADLDAYSAYYDADNPRPIKAYPPKGDRTDGDDLIRRIETGIGYTWRRKPGKREFWKNFVNEMTDDGEIAATFRLAMLENGYQIDMADGVIREAGDGTY